MAGDAGQGVEVLGVVYAFELAACGGSRGRDGAAALEPASGSPIEDVRALGAFRVTRWRDVLVEPRGRKNDHVTASCAGACSLAGTRGLPDGRCGARRYRSRRVGADRTR